MPTTRAIRLGLVALTLVLFGSVASAQSKQKISVLGLEAVVGANGQIDPADTAFAREITKELRARANNSKTYVLTKDDRQLVDEKLMNNCGSELPQCMAPIGASVGADVLLFGKVANIKGGYKVSLTLIDVRNRKMINSDPNANITGAETKNPGLANWVREHYRKVTNESSDGQLIITVAGANNGRVLVNGDIKETIRSGSATLSLPEGRYRVGVEADGFKLWEQDAVTISADKPTELKPELVKSKAPIDTTLEPKDPKDNTSTTTTTGTVDLTSREGTVSGKKNKTAFKVAAAVGLGGAVVGGAFMAYSFKQMNDFDSVKPAMGATWEPDPNKKTVSDADCGDGKFTGGNASDLNSKFTSACSAKDRMKWLVPTTVGLAAIGAGALIYVIVSKDDDAEQRPAGATGRRVKKNKNLIVTPVITPDNTGATLRFDW